MTTSVLLDAAAEAAEITASLVARADPSYEWGMRRTVPSEQPAHATRVPEVRKVAAAWSREHRGAPAPDVLAVCEALWASGWREERIAAIQLLGRRPAFGQVEWGRIERWSREIDNWEHVDNLADVTGRLLQRRPDLLGEVGRIAASDHPWQRRLALVTLIVAARDGRWEPELTVLTERLTGDKHPLVRKAVVWAHRELRQRETAHD